MAYFETLGQLQTNDYTFQELCNIESPNNVVLDGSVYGFEVNDIIMLIGGIYSMGLSQGNNCSVSALSISGSDKIFFSTTSGSLYTTVAQNWFSGHSCCFYYIGKVTQNNLTIQGTFNGATCINSSVYRLCPRN